MTAKVSWGLLGLAGPWAAHATGQVAQLLTMAAGTVAGAWYSQYRNFTSHPGLKYVTAFDLAGWGEEPPTESLRLCGKNKIPPTWDLVISPGRKSLENFSEMGHALKELESSALRGLLLLLSLQFWAD